uniref:Uncharacterized protein n=1 Tax=Leersia perrieri TaxID=77586 RepID=A0A0D9V3D8_9ORYZ
MTTSADDEGVDVQTAVKTMRALTFGEKSTNNGATLRRAPLNIATVSGGGPQAATLPKRAIQWRPKARWRSRRA